MSWKTTTRVYSHADLQGTADLAETPGAVAGNLAKDINDFLTANDGTLDATSFPNIAISSIGDSVLVVMSIENS